MILSHALRAAAGVSSAPATTDPQFPYVTMLLNGDGTNGAQNNTFLDSSSNNFTITRNGSPTQGSVTPFGNNWSNFFEGTASYLTTPNSTLFNIGTGDFTLECWVYATSLPTVSALLSTHPSLSGGGYGIYIASGVPNGQVFTNGSGLNDQVTSPAIVVNTWNHLALVRNGGSLRLYTNGVGGTAIASSRNPDNGIGMSIGIYEGTFYRFAGGNISNVRAVIGTAVYTANFTPPTTPLTAITNTSLLTCQSNRFVDNSSNNFTITRVSNPSVQPFSPFASTSAYSTSVDGGSMYFIGNNSNYLSVPVSSSFSLTGNFTIEAFVYIPAGTTQTAYSNIYNGSASPNTGIYSSFAGNNRFGFFSATPSLNIGSTVPSNDGAWHHMAVVRNGSTITLYVDGISRGTATNSSTFNMGSTTVGRVGAGSNGGADNPFSGYISNLRLVNGTAVYTANFTPPTAPLTAITNTSLLLNGINAGIFDNAEKNNLTTIGNAQVSTSVTKFGTGSMSFDGTGDWLTAIDNPNLQFGTGKFTIEAWVYLNAVGSARGFVSKGTATTGWSLGTNSSNQVVFSNTATSFTSTGTLAVSTWYFVTVVREGTGTNQTKIYINGTNDGTSTVSTNFNQTNIMYVGADRVGGSALNGYIDDLRITRGVARYTANFTPPTAAFPTN